MVSSINTNTAALFAQANIATATAQSASSVARLSSGNRIVQASDDVTALAIGTSLGTQVSALKTAQTNASQGSSLLQVADGALAQIQSILQQQQSIAEQAQSGSLTDTDRGFLNQEFQSLSNEINSLASGTTFNGVNLIDGSIAAAGTVGSANPLVSTSADVSTATTLAGAATGFITESAGSLTGLGVAQYGFTGTANASNSFKTSTLASPSSNPNGNDTNLTVTNLGAATATASLTSGTVDSTGVSTTASSYTVNVTVGGVAYTGTLQMALTGDTGNATNTTHGKDGSVAGGTTLVLNATTSPNDHASITLTVADLGFTGTSHADGDLSTLIGTTVQAAVRSATEVTGSLGAVTVTKPATAGAYDPALQGDLSRGTFSVSASASVGVAGTVASSGGTATGYTINYSINGITYQGLLANDGTPGHGTTSTTAVTLTALTDPGSHSTISITPSVAFGSGATTTDQSANILAALNTKFANASLVSPTASAIITGTTSTSGITAIAASNDIGQNDTALVGDLSKGTFNVTGSNSSGFTVSYSLNGSTYQGFLSSYKATNGGSLILDNGTGSISFGVGASASASGSTADVLKAALSAFVTSTTDGVTTGATALATHSVATALSKDTAGKSIAGSGVTAASTTGTVLEGFSGSNVTLTSASFAAGDSQIPPLSTFTATGTGASTVFSVIIDGVTYSTGSVAAGGVNNDDDTGNASDGVLKNTKFEGNAASTGVTAALNSTAGILTFFKNGDDTSKDQLVLNLSGVTAGAKINTTGDISNIVDALNNSFGSGGSTGGLQFQLGTTSTSNVTVNIGSAKTTALFGATPLDISTQVGADTAATAVGAALDTITSLRSGVGALETQFNFASAALQSSVQNEGAAQSSLLDTDISTESTNFATEQVKLQAGISVLAQANQQLQALLKLIG